MSPETKDEEGRVKSLAGKNELDDEMLPNKGDPMPQAEEETSAGAEDAAPQREVPDEGVESAKHLRDVEEQG